MTNIQVYKRKTILVKRNNEKIVVDIPFEHVDKAISNTTTDTMSISKTHKIKKSAINEWYAYNVTDEIEAWIDETYKEHSDEIMRFVNNRKKTGQKVNKIIVTNYVESL